MQKSLMDCVMALHSPETTGGGDETPTYNPVELPSDTVQKLFSPKAVTSLVKTVLVQMGIVHVKLL